MRRSSLTLPVLAALLRASAYAAPTHGDHGGMESIVSAAWLSQNVGLPSLVVVDIRPAEAYAAGHVPTSLSLPFLDKALWTSMGAGENETLIMPPDDVARSEAGAAGLLPPDRHVVLIANAGTMPFDAAQSTRAAATLRYIGFPEGTVALLDGGYPAWAAAAATSATGTAAGGSLTVSTVPGVPRPGVFKGTKDASFIVEREYVHAQIGKASAGVVIIDARPKASYDAGHIESALSLPGMGIWNANAMWKSPKELMALFSAAVGTAPVGAGMGEVIVYCQIGLLATTWFYALTNVLGFENVKLYDGSYEDWTKKYSGVPTPMVM